MPENERTAEANLLQAEKRLIGGAEVQKTEKNGQNRKNKKEQELGQNRKKPERLNKINGKEDMAVTLKENNGDFVLLLYGEPDSGSSEKLKNNTASGLDSTRLQQLKERGQTKIFAETPEGQPYASLPAAELFGLAKQIQAAGLTLDLSRLPKNIRDMLTLALKVENRPPKDAASQSGPLERIGKKSFIIYEQVESALRFMHETNLSLLRFFSGRAIWRRKDFWFIFGDCSYKAVGIIALVSFLVGLILAFVGALQLRTFGAGIYVASMVALGMTRIMAAIMVGIIMAGRTGSSYAATLGTMQVNEEIDALKTLGIKISDYLVTPRLVSLVVTIPFLTLLADALGILGGAVVGVSFLDLSSSSYFDYSIKALSLKNILVGLMHSVVYGIIISLCGCYEGLNAGRDADSVGKATTGAVVTALVWMIVATGVLTVILEEMGI